MRIKALQLTSHSAFQSTSDRFWRWNLGASGGPRRRCGSQLSADPLASRRGDFEVAADLSRELLVDLPVPRNG